MYLSLKRLSKYLRKGVSLTKAPLIRFGIYLLAYLLLGRYKEGWRYYEARFNCPDFDDVTPPTSGDALQSISLLRNLVKSHWLSGLSRGWEM